MLTWIEIVTVDPRLSTVPSFMQTLLLTAAEKDVGVQIRDYELARIYLTLHRATMFLRAQGTGIGQSGTVAQESLGDASTTYGNPGWVVQNSSQNYELTNWGLLYLEITRLQPSGAFVI
jgi:hypothetical protein